METEAEKYKALEEAFDRDLEETPTPLGNGNGKSDRGDRGDGNNKGSKDNEKHKYVVYKYSDRQRKPLHEAVIIDGAPYFLYLDSNDRKFRVVQEIEENTRILRPPNPEEYPYLPYEFDSIHEISNLLMEVKEHPEISYYYKKCKSIIKKHNDQDDYKLNLVASDITWTYLQDKFPTTHYLNIIGDNGSGKSSLGLCIEILGYRPVNMTSPSAANLFRVLGTIEAGQCIVIAEEAEKIDRNTEILPILKTGYHVMGKVAKVNLNIQKQEFFWTFCYKVIISERSLSRETAKGVLDRTFIINTFNGKPIYDIKETLNPAGNELRKSLFDEIMHFRKLMLLSRLVHYQDTIQDINIGLEGRDKELCKPLRQLFYNTDVEMEIKSSIDQFLGKKKQNRGNMLEVALIPILGKLISDNGIEFRSSLVWKEIIQQIEGTYDNERQPNDYHTADFGTIYRTTITSLICDKFGAERKHTKKGSVLIFDITKFVKTCKTYVPNEDFLDVQTKLASTITTSANSDDDNTIDITTNPSLLPSPPSPCHPSSSSSRANASSGDFPPKCYYCNINGFSTKDLYEEHGIRIHKNLPLYPGPADLEKLGLTPQGMSWEKELPRDQYFGFELNPDGLKDVKN